MDVRHRLLVKLDALLRGITRRHKECTSTSTCRVGTSPTFRWTWDPAAIRCQSPLRLESWNPCPCRMSHLGEISRRPGVIISLSAGYLAAYVLGGWVPGDDNHCTEMLASVYSCVVHVASGIDH